MKEVARHNAKIPELEPGVKDNDNSALPLHAEFVGLLGTAKSKLKSTRQRATRAENKARSLEMAKHLVCSTKDKPHAMEGKKSAELERDRETEDPNLLIRSPVRYASGSKSEEQHNKEKEEGTQSLKDLDAVKAREAIVKDTRPKVSTRKWTWANMK